MDVSRFIFRKETQEKLEEANRWAIGKKRWEKLKELENSGELNKLNTTKDVVEALGYDRDNKAAGRWFDRLIRLGNVRKEPIAGELHHYNYYTVSTPDYDGRYLEKARAAKAAKREALEAQEATVDASVEKKPTTEKAPYGTNPISPKTKELLIKIVEMQRNGELQKVVSRPHLAFMLGFPPRDKKFSVWISGVIRNSSVITEDYSATPVFTIDEDAVAKLKTRYGNKLSDEKLSDEKQSTNEIKMSTEGMTMTIRYGEMVIEFGNVNQSVIDGIIDKLTSK